MEKTPTEGEWFDAGYVDGKSDRLMGREYASEVRVDHEEGSPYRVGYEDGFFARQTEAD